MMPTDHNARNLALLRAGDRDGLVTTNVKLVYRLVHKYIKYVKYLKQPEGPQPYPTLEELEAIGLCALVKAARIMPVDCQKPSALSGASHSRRLKGDAAKHWTAGVPRGHGAVRLRRRHWIGGAAMTGWRCRW